MAYVRFPLDRAQDDSGAKQDGNDRRSGIPFTILLIYGFWHQDGSASPPIDL